MDSNLTGRRILVVEDEMLVAMLVEDMLTDIGCEVIGPAATVDEALSIIEAQLITAVVLDVNLSGQMSYPVADALIARGVPFVFSTGYTSNRLQEGYRAFPALQKPYHTTDLRDALEGAIAQVLPGADPVVETGVAHLATEA